MLVVYVAGPYRASNEWEVELNVRKAEGVALEIWQAGFACICPHKNTARFGGAADDEVWLAGDREIVRRSDAIVLVEGWENSAGATAEKALAEDCGIPVFDSVSALLDWGGS